MRGTLHVGNRFLLSVNPFLNSYLADVALDGPLAVFGLLGICLGEENKNTCLFIHFFFRLNDLRRYMVECHYQLGP